MCETRSQYVSIVPAGTGISFCIISQHFVLGYFRQVPSGPILTNHLCNLSRQLSLRVWASAGPNAKLHMRRCTSQSDIDAGSHEDSARKLRLAEPRFVP